MKRFRLPFLFAMLGPMLAPTPLLACSVCMGSADSPVAPAVNAAIFLMLGCIGCVLTGVGSFAFYLNRKAKGPQPPWENWE